MFKCRISNDISELNELNKIYKWIPNENQVRPSKETKEKKDLLYSYLISIDKNINDYILENIFLSSDTWIFIKSMFPYNIETGNHYILWNKLYKFNQTIDENEINTVISENIFNLVNHCNYDFVWYINPKLTIPDIFHVQVFWTSCRL